MKFLETSFNDYIQKVEELNIHKNNEKIIDKIPKQFDELNNILLYGPKGIGKYSQSLYIIKQFSNTNMKFEKKLNILFQKKYNFNFKISDIHYEIDMSLLGCNARILWHEIYNHIIDIISSKQIKKGIILCKNFQDIKWDLLEIFYKYMSIEYKNINIKFILISEHIGFIDEDILNICDIINFSRPTKTLYNKIIPKKINTSIKTYEITNIKNLKTGITQLMNPHYIICNKIIDFIVHYKELDFLNLREQLYNLLTYDISIEESIWYIIKTLYDNNYISNKDMFHIHNKLNNFLKLYTNNYRPIFHLEKIMLYLCKIVNGL